jgi:hypothetical protein
LRCAQLPTEQRQQSAAESVAQSSRITSGDTHPRCLGLTLFYYIPNVLKISHVQRAVGWQELQRLEFVPALGVFPDARHCLHHGVMEMAAGGILPHNCIQYAALNGAVNAHT